MLICKRTWVYIIFFFFFSSRRRHTRCSRDWSSDVYSSDLARLFGAELLDPADIGLSSHGWRDETPLWFYILREADVVGDGDRLGPVGGRIVGEVLVGLLDRSEERRVGKEWRRRWGPESSKR